MKLKHPETILSNRVIFAPPSPPHTGHPKKPAPFRVNIFVYFCIIDYFFYLPAENSATSIIQNPHHDKATLLSYSLCYSCSSFHLLYKVLQRKFTSDLDSQVQSEQARSWATELLRKKINKKESS